MDNDQPVTPDVELPGQEAETVDLEPSIEPEGQEPEASGVPAQSPDADPELGNTLIAPGNS